MRLRKLACDHVDAVVRRGIIDDADFERGAGAAINGFQAIAQQITDVVIDDDDTEVQHGNYSTTEGKKLDLLLPAACGLRLRGHGADRRCKETPKSAWRSVRLRG